MGRVVSAVAVVATLSVISVPAQQGVLPASPLMRGDWYVLTTPAAPAFSAVLGAALKADSSRFANAPVRLRNARTGSIVRTDHTDNEGLFRFRPVERGSYVVELTSEMSVLAASPLFNLNAGEIVQTIVREPFGPDKLLPVADFAETHASAVQAAAEASGILAVKPGDPVSPR
ncbi:MAG: carboxypeptidase regulatory-like domain-containing protein [Acidimicrobiia bacterium]|nr:carboxypeptidase regulatory-like domain-containing protein [Acidimicrobiia bacterium]